MFDLDGTLIDSAPDLALALNNTLQSLEYETFSPNTIRSWVGNGAQMLVKRGLCGNREADQEIDPELLSDTLSRFLECYGQNLCVDTTTYPNVIETLFSLKAQGYRLVLVTNKPHAFIQPILERFGIAELFELCLGGDSLAKRKPDPMPLFHVCETLDICPSRCVMVGDSKNDIQAAAAANIHSIAVSYGYNYDEDIRFYEPDHVTHDFSEITAILGEMR